MAYRVNVLLKLGCGHVTLMLGHCPPDPLPTFFYCLPCNETVAVTDSVSAARERASNGRA